MSRNGKIILGIIAGLVVLCACIAIIGAVFFIQTSKTVSQVVERSVDTEIAIVNTPDSENVKKLASSIADFEVPAGYEPEASVSLLGFTVVTFGPGDGTSHLYLMQFPAAAEVNREAMETQLLQTLRSAGRSWDATEMHQVGEIVKTVRDEEVTFTVSEGTDSDGNPFRAVIGVFQGKSGPALLMFLEPLDRWDEAKVDALLQSLK